MLTIWTLHNDTISFWTWANWLYKKGSPSQQHSCPHGEPVQCRWGRSLRWIHPENNKLAQFNIYPVHIYMFLLLSEKSFKTAVMEFQIVFFILRMCLDVMREKMPFMKIKMTFKTTWIAPVGMWPLLASTQVKSQLWGATRIW